VPDPAHRGPGFSRSEGVAGAKTVALLPRWNRAAAGACQALHVPKYDLSPHHARRARRSTSARPLAPPLGPSPAYESHCARRTADVASVSSIMDGHCSLDSVSVPYQSTSFRFARWVRSSAPPGGREVNERLMASSPRKQTGRSTHGNQDRHSVHG